MQRPKCPVCQERSVGINYRRKDKTYYRKRCDWCIYHNKQLRPLVSTWVKTGYRKKPACEKCGFVAKLKEQLLVAYIDGDVSNNDWMNLKTVCLNCQVDIEKSVLPWKISR